MTKRNKIIYWVSTLWLSLGMISTGIAQVVKMEEEITNFTNLGFPLYLRTIIGIWKFLGVIAILIPKYPLIKEWAYAGFFFTMTGALMAHLIIGDKSITLFGPVLLLVLAVVSWYFRPPDKKLVY